MIEIRMVLQLVPFKNGMKIYLLVEILTIFFIIIPRGETVIPSGHVPR